MRDPSERLDFDMLTQTDKVRSYGMGNHSLDDDMMTPSTEYFELVVMVAVTMVVVGDGIGAPAGAGGGGGGGVDDVKEGHRSC